MTTSSRVPTDRRRPFFGRAYARVSERLEDEGMRDLRRELVEGLTGTVVEVGAGNGLMFAQYPSAVTRLHAVEPEPYLRALAERASIRAPVPVTVHAGRAERLPLPDHGVDAAVLCLVVCSLGDRTAALTELRRVLRPGGTVRFLEHTLAETRGLRAVQRIADATLWPLLAGGCHTATDTVALVRAAGFTVTDLRQFRFPDTGPTTPATPHVMGTARAPDDA